jgi:hypothetical protein
MDKKICQICSKYAPKYAQNNCYELSFEQENIEIDFKTIEQEICQICHQKNVQKLTENYLNDISNNIYIKKSIFVTEKNVKKQKCPKTKMSKNKNVQKQKCTISEKYYCKYCNYKCEKKSSLIQHLRSNKHYNNIKNSISKVENKNITDMNGITNNTKEIKNIKKRNTKETMIDYKYNCTSCNYKTNRQFLWKQHIQTIKHTKNINTEQNVKDKEIMIKQQENKEIENNKLGNKEIENKQQENNKLGNKEIENIFINLIKQNEKINTILEEQQKTNEKLIDQQNKILDLANTPRIINKTYNTFNLNNFLNIDCKDAPNFKDFIFSIEIGRKELEFLQEYGYLKSFEDVILKQLENMEQTQRPLHCLDQKRKKFIIKHENNWTKEDIEKRIRLSIDHFSTLLILEYNKWKDEHPYWKDNTDDEIFDIGIHMSNEILSPYNNKKTEKIESKVLQGFTGLTINKK